MTPEEIVHSLNCCFGFGTCEECTARGIEHDPLPCKMSCKESLGLFAADLIEQQTARIAELEAKAAQERLAATEKQLQLADPDMVLFKQQFEAVQEAFNKLLGIQMRIESSNPENGQKLKKAIAAMAESFKSRV